MKTDGGSKELRFPFQGSLPKNSCGSPGGRRDGFPNDPGILPGLGAGSPGDSGIPLGCVRPKGFLMSLEAAASLLLVLIALSTLALFEVKQGHEGDFFLCSDAAVALVKTGAFSGGHLREAVEEASGISGLCISAGGQSSCSYGGQEKYSFSMPVWSGLGVQSAEVSCWRR